jgi:hypothetical protein
MKKYYDFSKAEQGKFYRPLKDLELPIYLDKEVNAFFVKHAAERNTKLEKIVNKILRKEMEILQDF